VFNAFPISGSPVFFVANTAKVPSITAMILRAIILIASTAFTLGLSSCCCLF
jgi:hypothetical protein